MTLPVIALSGLASDAATWSALETRLTGSCELVPLVAQGASIADMAADVLVRAPQHFALVGHSMGGYVALAVAAAAPDRVSRLALVNSSAAPDRAEQTARRQALITQVGLHGYEKVVAALLPAFLHPDAFADPDLADTVRAMVLRAGPERFIGEQRAIIGRPDMRPWLATAPMPVLAIGSEDDKVVAPDDAREAAGLAPAGRLTMLTHCGHMAPLEQPAEVAAALLAWLRA
jgi:pimeloyl-ACP methyl ester carboxylesterase